MQAVTEPADPEGAQPAHVEKAVAAPVDPWDTEWPDTDLKCLPESEIQDTESLELPELSGVASAAQIRLTGSLEIEEGRPRIRGQVTPHVAPAYWSRGRRGPGPSSIRVHVVDADGGVEAFFGIWEPPFRGHDDPEADISVSVVDEERATFEVTYWVQTGTQKVILFVNEQEVFRAVRKPSSRPPRARLLRPNGPNPYLAVQMPDLLVPGALTEIDVDVLNDFQSVGYSLAPRDPCWYLIRVKLPQKSRPLVAGIGTVLGGRWFGLPAPGHPDPLKHIWDVRTGDTR